MHLTYEQVRPDEVERAVSLGMRVGKGGGKCTVLDCPLPLFSSQRALMPPHTVLLVVPIDDDQERHQQRLSCAHMVERECAARDCSVYICDVGRVVFGGLDYATSLYEL